MELFDSHLHLDDEAFALDRDAVLGRARAAGIVRMVTVGTDIASSRVAIALAEGHSEIFAAVAVHPQNAREATEDAMAELRRLATHPKVVAVGETGLDFSRAEPPQEIQRDALRDHIRLSSELGLPIIIHCRKAHAEVLDTLQDARVPKVIMHAFSGSTDVAAKCVARGYAISLAGPVTFRNARGNLDVAQAVPLELLLVETDAPVLAPEPFRGRRNEPAYLTHTVARVAALRNLGPDEIADVTTANARRIYGVN